MFNESRLREIASSLAAEQSYFAKWDINYLQAFIRDGGNCQYCERYLFEDYDVASCGDHLLPRKSYPELIKNVHNLVACCTECNQIKRDFDPAKNDPGDLGNEEYRKRIVEKAKNHVKTIGAKRNWRAMFDDARAAFEKKVHQYRGINSGAAK